MKLNSLPKTTTSAKKRLGRGYGSGKGGHTATRGTKGQKARSKVHIWFEGGQLPLIKRLPFQRGKGRFKSLKKNPLIVNLKYLNVFPQGSQITIKTLVNRDIVTAQAASTYGVKILGGGKLEKALKVTLPTSKSAAKAIKKAGGSIVKPTVPKKRAKASPKKPARPNPAKSPSKKKPRSSAKKKTTRKPKSLKKAPEKAKK